VADLADSGDALSDVADATPPALTHTEHLAAAHAHVLGASAHLAAAQGDNDGDASTESPAEAATDAPGARAMMPAGSAQARSFAFQGGAAHALRQATRGRRG
jgi:hypothetical protein